MEREIEREGKRERVRERAREREREREKAMLLSGIHNVIQSLPQQTTAMRACSVS